MCLSILNILFANFNRICNIKLIQGNVVFHIWDAFSLGWALSIDIGSDLLVTFTFTLWPHVTDRGMLLHKYIMLALYFVFFQPCLYFA